MAGGKKTISQHRSPFGQSGNTSGEFAVARSEPQRSSPKQPCSYTVLKMQKIVDRFNIPLIVCWNPQPGKDKHGEIELSSRTIFLYDVDESDAWQTFTHELFEWKLKAVSEVYRATINKLIELLEELAYKRKEEFLDLIPQVFKELKET